MYRDRPTRAQLLEEYRSTTMAELAIRYGVGKTTISRWLNSDTMPINKGSAAKGRPDPHKYCLLPCLEEKMRVAGATIEALAEQAGTSVIPIHRARKGLKVHLKFAIILYQTLNERKFKRDPRGGHKWSESRWAAYKRRELSCQ